MAELYAIVGDMERARFMLAAGVPYLQLRFKERPLAPHEAELRRWVREHRSTRLIINDDLAAAERVGAWGCHLGQEDLRRHAPRAVRQTRVRVGVSTHSDEEIRIALDAGADLIGFGPVFATGTKAVGFAPQGLERLAEVVRRVPVPVIAIGGIDDANMEAVAATGAAMVAMIGYLDTLTGPAAVRDTIARLRRAAPPA